MFFDIEKLSEYNPENLRVNFKTLVKVDIKTFGFIQEKKLHTPCYGTKMSIEQIFRYQEQGYVIKYDDTYVEDMYFLACFYNAKVEMEHQNNRSLRLKPLEETMKILKKRLARNPKFRKIFGEIKLKDNPFFDSMIHREIKNNYNTDAKVEQLKSEFEVERYKNDEKLDYNDLAFVEEELNNFYKDFRELNKYNRDPRTEISKGGELNRQRKDEKLINYDM